LGLVFSKDYKKCNFFLGQKRAITVKDVLIRQGVNQDRIFVVSYGEQLEKLSEGDEKENEQSRKALVKAASKREDRCFRLN
jgi:outer membrane protein OmpA-like peptidoglycan-associated protein